MCNRSVDGWYRRASAPLATKCSPFAFRLHPDVSDSPRQGPQEQMRREARPRPAPQPLAARGRLELAPCRPGRHALQDHAARRAARGAPPPRGGAAPGAPAPAPRAAQLPKVSAGARRGGGSTARLRLAITIRRTTMFAATTRTTTTMTTTKATATTTTTTATLTINGFAVLLFVWLLFAYVYCIFFSSSFVFGITILSLLRLLLFVRALRRSGAWHSWSGAQWPSQSSCARAPISTDCGSPPKHHQFELQVLSLLVPFVVVRVLVLVLTPDPPHVY